MPTKPKLPQSAWLLKPNFEPNPQATMVEYLRWMRSPDNNNKNNNDNKKNNNDTKLYLLQLIEEKLNNPSYSNQLERLTDRTKKIVKAKNGFIGCFTAPWRIRVGGTKGPENMLLPAFDALGIPYIPSSTLRGVARATALRIIKAKFVKNINKEQPHLKPKEVEEKAQSLAQKQVNSYFGALDADKPEDRIGKVTFLDAYLLPKNSNSGGLEIDIANSIWTWKDKKLEYNPNPNLFLSLKEATFVIGIFPRVNDQESKSICKKAIAYLMKGLKRGIGAQVNSGYGRLIQTSKLNTIKESPFPQEFFRLKFVLQGQQIHNVSKFSNRKEPYKKNKKGQLIIKKGQLIIDTKAESEVRPIALKSMLRYWFRIIALGVLEVETLQTWERKLFGGIDPKPPSYGWVQVQTIELPEEIEDKNEQVGILSLSYSPEAPKKEEKQDTIRDLFENLIWLMFRLGGVGQGARRPFYERPSTPQIRGSTLYPLSSDNDNFWGIPDKIKDFQGDFQQRLKKFYQALYKLKGESEEQKFELKSIGTVSEHQWTEAMDKNCQVWVVSGQDGVKKPYALKTLHRQYHQLKDQEDQEAQEKEERKQKSRQNKKPILKEKKEYSKAKSLCGGIDKDFMTDENGNEKERGVTPSPIWIADLDIYQVVTVFGYSEGERKKYLNTLTENNNREQIFPLPTQEAISTSDEGSLISLEPS